MKILTIASLIFLTLIIGYLIEGAVLKRASSKALSEEYYFPERMAAVDLDWDGPDIQACAFEYHFLIYGYQTCFIKSYKNEKNADGSFSVVTDESGEKIPSAFTYVYTSPSRKLTLNFGGVSGTKPHHLRFTLPVFTASPVTIFRDGEIVKNVNESKR